MRSRIPALRIATVILLGSLLIACEYARLVRPQSLKQLNPDMVALVNELPEVDQPNEEIVGRLFAHGGLGHAKRHEDGIWRADIRVPEGQFIWKPAIIVMEQGGELELNIANDDGYSHHAALLPSNETRMLLTMAPHESGRARVRLSGPGLYWFGCPIANHAGRGMLGLIIVSGKVPQDARLDRPRQRQPGE